MCLSIHPSIHPSMHVCIYASMCLRIYALMYLCIYVNHFWGGLRMLNPAWSISKTDSTSLYWRVNNFCSTLLAPQLVANKRYINLHSTWLSTYCRPEQVDHWLLQLSKTFRPQSVQKISTERQLTASHRHLETFIGCKIATRQTDGNA